MSFVFTNVIISTTTYFKLLYYYFLLLVLLFEIHVKKISGLREDVRIILLITITQYIHILEEDCSHRLKTNVTMLALKFRQHQQMALPTLNTAIDLLDQT